jgi:hypothetical protein
MWRPMSERGLLNLIDVAELDMERPHWRFGSSCALATLSGN